MAVNTLTLDQRTVCQQCGGWAETQAVAAEFLTLHDHPAGAPIIYKTFVDPSLWSVPDLLAGAPTGGRIVVFIGKETIRKAKRIVAATPEELRASLI